MSAPRHLNPAAPGATRSPWHALALIALAVAPLVMGGFTLRFAAEILLVGVAVMSLNVLIGVGGLVSLGHAAVFGAAAYVAAVGAPYVGGELGIILAVGMLTGAGVAATMALLSLRTTGLFFLVLTLLAGQMVWEVVFRWRSVTGGADGLRGFPSLSAFGVPLGTSPILYALALGVALVSWWVLRSFRRAPIGLALQGMRDQPLRMRALGYRLGVLRLAAFAVTGAVAGMAGSLYPFVNQYVGPNVVHWSMSATLVIMGVLGGIGTLVGGFIGAAVYLVAQTQLSSFTDRWQLAIGLLFVATVIFVPHGLLSGWLTRTRRHAAALAPAARPSRQDEVAERVDTPAVARSERADAEVLLHVAGLSHAFDGVRVLNGIDLDVYAGETLGLIGPNGAGKTTLFNIISGFVQADEGALVLADSDLTRRSPEARNKLGMVRTFQKSLVFPSLSIRGNVALAIRAARASGYRWRGAAGALAHAYQEADRLLAQSPFDGRTEESVAALSYGEKRVLDVLIALAQAPKLLLLDEPTAGLSEPEARALLALVRHRHADTSVILVSHDVDVVFRSCDRIAVLDLGRLIAVDTPARIRQHPQVMAAYLGVAPQPSVEGEA